MAAHDHEFDPDDNFSFGAPERDDAEDEAHDGDLDAIAWQWLLHINPGDEDAATQQWQAFREALGDDDAPGSVHAALESATDWRASFRVHEDERATLIDAIATLAERFRVELDWGVDDPTDAAALAGVSTHGLIDTACDQLRVAGYTLWTWDTGDATVAGVIAPRDDDAGMRLIGHALGLDVRPGAG